MSSTKSSSEKTSIERTMTIDEIFSTFPHKAQRLAQELTNFGLHCVGCHAATWETLEAGCLTHGMAMEKVDILLEKLNAVLEEEVDLSTIVITERAANKYRQILKSENKDGWGLRFAEKAAGCSGYEYILDFSEKPAEDDVVFVSEGVDIHVQRAMVGRLLGSEIDYIDGLMGAGFKVTNPNVKSACGCGSSHNY